MLYRLADHCFHDVVVGVEQVVAAHARLAWNPRSDHDDVGIRGVFVVVGARDVRIALLNGHSFEQIEALTLRHAFNNVDEHYVGELFGSDPVSRSCAYVAGTYNRYFFTHE
jgi:hypothetical protein